MVVTTLFKCLWCCEVNSCQQVFHMSWIKKVNLDTTFISSFYKQIYTLCIVIACLFVHCIPQPKLLSTERKENTQDVKLPIKHYDMLRKVTGCTSHLLFHLIKKISFRYGHRWSGLMIFRPIFFYLNDLYRPAFILMDKHTAPILTKRRQMIFIYSRL